MRKTRRRGSRSLRLDFCSVDLDSDGPGDAVYHGEDIDGDDDGPAASTEGAVYGVTCVEPADQEHCGADPNSAVYDTVPAAPFVRQEESWDSHTENDDGGNPGCEKSGLRRGKAGLLEEERCIL